MKVGKNNVVEVVGCFSLILVLTFLISIQTREERINIDNAKNEQSVKILYGGNEGNGEEYSLAAPAGCVPGKFVPSNVKMVSETQPRVQVYEHFLTDEECEHIINLGVDKGLKRSQVASDGNIESEVRTSYGVFLTDYDPVLSSVEERIALWAKLPVEHGEPYYLLRYEVGQQYKPHYDYFDPAIKGMEQYLGAAGQRTATVLIYLETPEEGGETIFPNAVPPFSVKSVRGTAVLFWSMTTDNKLDTYSLHGSVPVVKGVKYCCTKWIRENPWRR